MATNFEDFIVSIYREVLSKTSLSLTILKEITVRQLAELSSFRTLANEATASFTIRSASPYVGEYADEAIDGFPRDAMEIDLVWYETGTTGNARRFEVAQADSMDEVRMHGRDRLGLTYLVGHPDKYFWFGRKMYFAPAVSEDRTIFCDYFRDARRDSTTGEPITVKSTKETNPWFDRGELVLRNAVLAEYFTMPMFQDQGAAAACAALRNQFLGTMTKELEMKKSSSIQAPAYVPAYSSYTR
jgi:hypothetical protein